MSNQIVPDYSFRHPTGDPYCLYCGQPKEANGELWCSRECHEQYQRALAATLPPLKITVTTWRERREGGTP